MKPVAILMLLFAPPFWESKPPVEWSREELVQMLSDSPWARVLPPPANAVGDPVRVYIASAEPCRAAEQEAARRAVRDEKDPGADEEYLEFLRDNAGKQIVLAVEVPGWPPKGGDPEIARMEKECRIKAGRREFRMSGSFPPTAADPLLRLAFPLELNPGDKEIVFELYLPGAALPYRRAEFVVRELRYRAKPAW